MFAAEGARSKSLGLFRALPTLPLAVFVQVVLKVAGWLVDVFQKACEGVGLCEAVDAGAHEVIAWAFSLAFTHSIPLSEVMQAAFWESQGTLLNFT